MKLLTSTDWLWPKKIFSKVLMGFLYVMFLQFFYQTSANAQCVAYFCGLGKDQTGINFDHGMVAYLRGRGMTVTPIQVDANANLINAETSAPITFSPANFTLIAFSQSAGNDINPSSGGGSALLSTLSTMSVPLWTNDYHLAQQLGYTLTTNSAGTPQKTMFIVDNTSPILPSGFPNQASVQVFSNAITGAYINYMREDYGLPAGSTLGAFVNGYGGPPQLGSLVTYLYVPASASSGTKVFLGYSLNGFEAAQFNPAADLTSDGLSLLNKSFDVLSAGACAATCTVPTAPNAPVVAQATCNAGGTANNDASISISGITNGLSYAYTTDGSTPAFASAGALTGGAINLTGLANPAAATTYKFRIFNGSADCFVDVTATLNPKTCTPSGPCVTVVPACPTALVIDNFNTPQPQIFVNRPNGILSAYSNISTTDAICGQRDSYIISDAGDNAGNLLSVGGGAFYNDEGPGGTAGIYFTYDGSNNATNEIPDATVGLGGINLSGRQFKITSVDHDIDEKDGTRYCDVYVKVWSSPTQMSQAVMRVDGNVPYNVATTLTFPALAGSADLTSVRAIQLFFDTHGNAVDVSFDDFVSVCNTCTNPTAPNAPVVAQATCNAAGTAANNDASISISGITNGLSYAYTTDGTTPAFASAVALSGSAINLTGLANPAAATTYKFRVFNGTADCFTDVSAVLNPKTCSPTCTPPNVAPPVATQATCNAAGTAANNDASVSISAVSSATSYAYTTDGSTPTFANAGALSGTSISLTNLANPAAATTYKFRVFNGTADCFTDVSVILNPKTCTPNCTPPNVATPTATQATCNAAGTAANNDASVSISTVNTATSYAYTTDGTTPAFVSAVALSGTSISLTNLANPATATTYKFRVFNGTADCFTDVSVILNPRVCTPNCVLPNVATPTATQATCNAAGTAANNDASVSISAVSSATSYAYTTDGSTPTFANAVALSGTSISLTNLANPAAATTYKFRVFNGTADCFTDVSAVLNPKTCSPTCTPPNVAPPVATQATCNAAGTAANNDASVSISAISSATSYAYTTDGSTPAFANAVALSGTSISLTNLANLAAATTYKFRVFNGTADCFTDVSVVLNPKTCTPNCTPPTPVSQGKSTCDGNSTTLTVTGCDATYPAKWYSNSALTTEVGTGNSFTTPTLTGTTSYYVACVMDVSCKSSGVPVTVTVLPKPAPIKIGTGQTYTLTTEAGTTSIQWYKDGVAIAGAAGTANILAVTAPGSYTYSGFKPNSDLCKDTLCCPIVFIPVGSLGDFVWKDTNNNGIQDETTPNGGGVAGVQIELYKNGTLFAKDTTDATGKYLFTNLDAGTYKIKVLTASVPAGCEISSVKDAPNDDAKDSDVDKITGFSGDYVITPTDPTMKDIVTVDAALAVPCAKSNVTLIGAPACAADVKTYSFTFNVVNKVGIVKVSKGVLTGTNPYTVTGIPSGSTVKITDSLSAICKYDTLITGPNCNCNPPLPTLVTPSLTACIGDTFPTLKATVVGLATVEWFTQATGGTAVFTVLNYKPAGTVTVAGAVFYAQARSTDPACPVAISTGRVSATVNAQDCTKEVDLALKKSINTKIARIGDVLTYTLKVWNESNTNATGLEVTDSIATTVQFQTGSFAASRGTAQLTGNVIKWTVGAIAANGDTVTLTYQVKATQEGVHFNTAEISKVTEKDRDSTPGNGKDGEDDIDRQCFTVPIQLCSGEKAQASVPASLTNVQWFKNGSPVSIASGNSVLLTEVGTYTFTAANQTCPVEGCCPIIIEAGINCCPAELCIPFTIKKRKK